MITLNSVMPYLATAAANLTGASPIDIVINHGVDDELYVETVNEAVQEMGEELKMVMLDTAPISVILVGLGMLAGASAAVMAAEADQDAADSLAALIGLLGDQDGDQGDSIA